MKTALVTGIGGQDGSYLVELLLDRGYAVHGICRRQSVAENQTSRLNHIQDRLTLHYGDVSDAMSLVKVFSDVQPDEVYNLAAQSHVRISTDVPRYTAETNAIGVLNVLQCVKNECPKARVYQASSSEMFGAAVDDDGFQRETTPFLPVSPYGIAKLFGFHTVRHYRAGHDLFATNGILFNHTSPRRGINFVEAKLAKSLAEIAAGKADIVELGNVHAKRDWGHSRDYTHAMWLMLQSEKPGDFVIATGETYSVWDFAVALCAEFGLEPDRVIKTGVERYQRPQELPYLRGDSTKARSVLGWTPTVTFKDLVKELADHWRAEVARYS